MLIYVVIVTRSTPDRPKQKFQAGKEPMWRKVSTRCRFFVRACARVRALSGKLPLDVDYPCVRARVRAHARIRVITWTRDDLTRFTRIVHLSFYVNTFKSSKTMKTDFLTPITDNCCLQRMKENKDTKCVFPERTIHVMSLPSNNSVQHNIFSKNDKALTASYS